MTRLSFPPTFTWGAATSAYQIEGSPLRDGGGTSIQHRFAHTPGNTVDGATGDLVADHYNRWREDIELMRRLGLQAYQFSIAWPRILPSGIGAVNAKGLDFYDRLVDALLDAGIAPTPILHVWDFPAVLQDQGGWANRDSALWFAEYASLVFERLGDRVARWLTICEPRSIAWGGYVTGRLAPCMRDLYAGLRAAHNVLLAHGRAVQAYRSSGGTGEIGTSMGYTDVRPASTEAWDLDAAERARQDYNALYLDPILLGSYPSHAREAYGDAFPEIEDDDLGAISQPLDFLGVTYYSGVVVQDVRADAGAEETVPTHPLGSSTDELILRVRPIATGRPVTGVGWDVHPPGLRAGLNWLRARYGDIPIIITEVGAAYSDSVVDGSVQDTGRISFLHDHIVAAKHAIDDGVDVRGIYVWSLLDTWEFWLGCTARFGLVHVDYRTLERRIKASGYWYKEVIAANGLD